MSFFWYCWCWWCLLYYGANGVMVLAMPAINVRLSEAEHEELRSAVFARGRGWSLQKEILQRCFGGVLAERDQARDNTARTDGDHTSTSGAVTGPPSPRSASVPKKSLVDPRLYSDVEIRKPAVCSRAFAHHNYHAGKPCPHCGYPDTP